MGTHAQIIVRHEDGSATSVYLHWDGYTEHAGKMLKQHYNTLALAEQLVAGGNLSSIYERIEPIGAHSFVAPEAGTCVYYNRDRGEVGQGPNKYPSVYAASRNASEEFNYLFEDGEWKVRGSRGTFRLF